MKIFDEPTQNPIPFKQFACIFFFVESIAIGYLVKTFNHKFIEIRYTYPYQRVFILVSNSFFPQFLKSIRYRSSDEVLHILSSILCAVQRARISLIIPKKKPIDELMKSRNMVKKTFLKREKKRKTLLVFKWFADP